ncbi:restriction endonuclease subunit S [Acetivibrio mesophilus]|uniref:Restriction endonuclease subunit S n=1 Tax=Acetivibrio mesophilus TaxID=2487273 RepID=A0A4Q0I0A7_9FIRM|nr:restriction endonuclease subunit S [Acetivibrio mesophilus]RXE57626.1 restriction endonuclease subunit S [Acetivibrio mesophilus]
MRLSDILSLSDISRLESEFYVAKTLNCDKGFLGKDILSFVQYGTSEELNEDNCGYPVLRLNEFDSNFIGVPSKYCSKLNEITFEELRLKKGDVLICRTNGNPKLVGKSAIVLEDTTYAFASYLFRIRPKTSIINSETLTIYLNSKHGRNEIEKYSMTSNQTNFSPAKFREIFIPHFSSKFQDIIGNLVSISFNLHKNSKTQYKEVENILSNELGYKGWKPTEENTATKKLSESFKITGRLDSEYYQPKYDEVLSKITKTYNLKLKDIVRIKKSIEPGSSVYQEEGLPFIRVSNLTKYGITQPDICIPHNITKNIENLKPKKDTILFSKDGSIGIAYKVEENLEAITSGAILHLRIKNKDILPDYLTLVLNSVLTQLQAERDSGGSIIQHWRLSDIENVEIPILEYDKQKKISEKIQEAFKLKKVSESLLEIAKTGVEKAIEEGDNSAIEWINVSIKKLDGGYKLCQE